MSATWWRSIVSHSSICAEAVGLRFSTAVTATAPACSKSWRDGAHHRQEASNGPAAAPRRRSASLVANVDKLRERFAWQPREFSLDGIVRSALDWEKRIQD